MYISSLEMNWFICKCCVWWRPCCLLLSGSEQLHEELARSNSQQAHHSLVSPIQPNLHIAVKAIGFESVTSEFYTIVLGWEIQLFYHWCKFLEQAKGQRSEITLSQSDEQLKLVMYILIQLDGNRRRGWGTTPKRFLNVYKILEKVRLISHYKDTSLSGKQWPSYTCRSILSQSSL